MPFEAPPWEVVGALLALVGVFIGVLLTNKLNRDRDRLELKRDVLRRVMGYRWQLTPGNARPDGLLHTALNEIPVVFAEDKDVGCAFKTFRERVDEGFKDEDLVPLAEAMAKSAKVPHEDWDRELVVRPLVPSVKSDMER